MSDGVISNETMSRRSFLRGSVASGSMIFLGRIGGKGPLFGVGASTQQEDALEIEEPTPGALVPGFLAAKLRWEYAAGCTPHSVVLSVATKRARTRPIVHATLSGEATTYCLPTVPEESYVWRIQPTDVEGHSTAGAATGSFTMGKIRLVQDAPPEEMYKNPRKGARYSPFKPIPFGVEEPLSPWYDIKRYTMGPPPKFDDVKEDLPCPILDGNPDALETYWYCWKTFIEVWNYAPYHPDNQAVANINGCPDWSGWGSSQVWDSSVMMHYAKYGNQTYSFITQYDNAYARQHENGFICQESDNDNREVYACHPALCPFLIGWAELDYYRISGDLERLRQIFMPLVKNYEWFMTYMRHTPDGIYGFDTPGTKDTCGTDSFDLPLQATAYRTAETLAMARIAKLVGRPDMVGFFIAEYRRLGDYINQHFWDAEHQLYNERCSPNFLLYWPKYRDPKLAGKFITEPVPGEINKSIATFLPLFAEIAPARRLPILKRLFQDPKNGFEWPNGIEGYSLDTTSTGPQDDTGAVATKIWPPAQYLVQQGFKQYGDWSVAQEVAERYFNAVVVAYTKDKMIREALDAKIPKFDGHKDFVGWGGLAPIANLIEYVLGFDIDVTKNSIAWHLHRTERHGLRHFRIGEFYVDLVCEVRETPDSPYQVTVTSGGSFTLHTIVNGKITSHNIGKGYSVLRIV